MKMIRTNIMFLQMTIVAGAMFASCSSNDNNEDIPESGNVTSYDQVKYLQNNIVEIDSMGSFVQRVNGYKLNSADSTELSVGVEDIAEATELFKSWLSPDTEVKTSSSSTDYDAPLKDGSNTVKETAHFKAVTGDGPTIAEMTFDSDKVMKHFSKVKFIKSGAWPENGGYSKHSLGDLVEFNTYDDGIQKWVCIREAKQGQSGLLMYISSYHGWWGTSYIYNFANVGLAKEASKILRRDWTSWVGYFKKTNRELKSGEYYWIDDWSWGLGIYAIRLSDGDVDWFHVIVKKPDHHFIQIKAFGLSQD